MAKKPKQRKYKNHPLLAWTAGNIQQAWESCKEDPEVFTDALEMIMLAARGDGGRRSDMIIHAVLEMRIALKYTPSQPKD